MTDPARPSDAMDSRSALELAQTAKARFETTEAAARSYGLDQDRVKSCGDNILDGIHRGAQQENVLWVIEIAVAMITAVMAVNREPLPVAQQVDPASYALSVLRDLATAAREKGLPWDDLETAAAACLRQAEAEGFNNQEVYWALNRATAWLELAWARSLAEKEGNPFSEAP